MRSKYNYFIALISVFFGWVFVFAIHKPMFMWWYKHLYVKCDWTDWVDVIWHGLPLDFSMAGYLTIIPGLLFIASVWTKHSWVKSAMNIYFITASLLVTTIFVADIALYHYWGFRIDTTPFFYFFSSPKDALASVSRSYIFRAFIAIVFIATIIYEFFDMLLINRIFIDNRYIDSQSRFRKHEETAILESEYDEDSLLQKFFKSFFLLLLTALLFIPIRGGFSVSTMNTGKVFYSTDTQLNHAALNPVFNLMESILKQQDFESQYRYMDDDEADAIFDTLIDKGINGKTAGLGFSQSPNVLFIILESFSSKLMATLGGESDVAINLDKLAEEGILFTNFYANSFRTDRGLVSILSGYPAQPTTSLMKYPRKTQNLPGIARSLKQAGYSATYYYGGDADFTNMRSYLMSQGFDQIISDTDFPVSERLSKWGAHDEVVFNRLLADLRLVDNISPKSEEVSQHDGGVWLKVLQTSSSHEPFEVPYLRLDNERLNAFAYTDECVGNFINDFKQLPQWENTLVVLVPDHLGAYPENISNFTPERYQIPLLMIGGVVKEPMRIDVIGSQQDIPATLLAQLGLSHADFTFSKDMLNPDNPHFAFFTVPDAFGMVTEDNALIFDNQAGKTVWDEGENPGANLLKGQAYLQKLYDDIAKR